MRGQPRREDDGHPPRPVADEPRSRRRDAPRQPHLGPAPDDPHPRPTAGLKLSSRRLEPPPISHGRLVDLDLGCLYEFTAGQRGVVQALGHRRGDFERPPYIRLDQDDRSGSAIGENLFINLDHADELSRVLVFVFAYQGAFDGANAKVTFHPATGNPWK
ncbi:hypothetical protein ACFQ9X_45465 [Catenulispora yoronensis]